MHVYFDLICFRCSAARMGALCWASGCRPADSPHCLSGGLQMEFGQAAYQPAYGTAFCRIFVSQDLHISVGHAAEPARMMSGRGTCPSEHIGAGALCATLSGQTLSTSVDCDPPLVCCTVYSCTCEMSEPSRGGLPPRNTAHACSFWKLRKSPSPKRPRAWPSRRFARVRVQALSACVAYWDADFLSRYAQRIARASEGHAATCGNMWRHVATGHVEVRGRWPRAP